MSETTNRSVGVGDSQIGAKIRILRSQRGMNQETLGEAIGVTFQQVQKYENGKNRVSATRLVKIAAALGCRAEDFLEPTVPGEAPVLIPAQVMRLANRLGAMPEERRAAVTSSLSKIVDLIEDARA